VGRPGKLTGGYNELKENCKKMEFSLGKAERCKVGGGVENPGQGEGPDKKVEAKDVINYGRRILLSIRWGDRPWRLIAMRK